MRTRRAWLALLVAVVAAGAAPAAADQHETVTLRYGGPDYVGWTAGNGGGYAELNWPPSDIAVPTWATVAEIRVLDDQRRPVHGVVTASWHGYPHHRAVFCSDAVTTLPVRDTTEMQVRIGEGVATTGVERGCLGPLSAPTTGTVTVTFSS